MAAGLTAGVHAGDGKRGNTAAQLGFRDDHAGFGVAGAATRRGRTPERGDAVTDRVALVTGAARGTGRGDRVRGCAQTVSASPPATCSSTNSTPPSTHSATPGWSRSRSTSRRPRGGRRPSTQSSTGSAALTTLVNNAGVLHRASLADRDPGRVREQLAGELSGPVSRHPGRTRTAPAGRRRGDRQHVQHRCSAAVPEPRRLRVVEVGAAGSDPDRRRRARGERNPGERGVPRTDRDTDARRGDPGSGWSPPRCRVDSASRSRSPMRWRSWYPSMRRSSPAANSSWTAGNACGSDEARVKTHPVGIIGAGPGGLALGIFLRKAGFRNFTIFDREDGVGGTWRINTYPGLACDVKSHLYSYSFDLNPNWSRLWSGQPEILDYFEQCARRYHLAPNLRLRTEIRSARMGFEEQHLVPDDVDRRAAPLRRRGVCRRPLHPTRHARTWSKKSRSPGP